VADIGIAASDPSPLGLEPRTVEFAVDGEGDGALDQQRVVERGDPSAVSRLLVTTVERWALPSTKSWESRGSLLGSWTRARSP
jgi:hypothetical protein